jgi:hypothetical protein
MRRADGTVGHPYSALNLRLVLAIFGLVSMLVLAVLAIVWNVVPVAVLALIVAVLAAFNIGFVQFRRRERAREEPDEDHSLFE